MGKKDELVEKAQRQREEAEAAARKVAAVQWYGVEALSHGGGPRIPRSCQEQERLEHEKELLGYMWPSGDECFHESSGQV